MEIKVDAFDGKAISDFMEKNKDEIIDLIAPLTRKDWDCCGYAFTCEEPQKLKPENINWDWLIDKAIEGIALGLMWGALIGYVTVRLGI